MLSWSTAITARLVRRLRSGWAEMGEVRARGSAAKTQGPQAQLRLAFGLVSPSLVPLPTSIES